MIIPSSMHVCEVEMKELQRLAGSKKVEEGGVELKKMEWKEEAEEGEGGGEPAGEEEGAKVTAVELESEGGNILSTFGHANSSETAKVRSGCIIY